MRNNIIDFFEKYSNLEFIIDSNDGRVYSYSDILRMSISLNNNLCDLSINSRSRVLIVLDHSVDFLVSILACAIGGHIACPVNPELFDKKLSLYKKLIGYDFVINKDSYKSISKKNNCKKMPAVNKDDNDFLILPSSGTTSDSKFIVLGIRTMLDSAISFSKLTNSTKKSRYIHNMPMYYMAGIFNLFFVPMVSGSSVLIESRTGPALLIDYWSNQYRHHVNRLILTPTVAYSVSRMEIDGLPMFQPTIYMVPDEYARKKAIKEGILSNLIKVVGQPAFAWVEEAFQCASQQKNPLETLSDNYVKTILFVSEPAAHDQGNSLEENPNYCGYTERDAIQILINAIKITDEQYLVAVLPHPRQDVERLKETWKSCGGDLYGSVQDVGLRGRDFLPFVHGVAGMSSTLLYEAWLVGKSVLRIQPGLLNESARNMERKEGIVLINQYANANEKALQWLTELPNFPTQQYQAELKLHKQAPKRIVEEIANLHR